MHYRTCIHKAHLGQTEKDRLLSVTGGQLFERRNYTDLIHEYPMNATDLSELRHEYRVDINPLPRGFDAKSIKLLVTDMDSTLVSIECIDEIADMINVKSEVEAITTSAMRGELDFGSALVQRVRLLKGLSVYHLQRVYDERLRLNPGGQLMLEELKRLGIKIAVVSGGFTYFTCRLKEQFGLDYALANVLEVENGILTGKVTGEIVDAERKAELLLGLCRKLGIDTAQSIAMGDGANDLKMLSRAGLGIAYHAKPAVRDSVDIRFQYCGLEGVCDLLQS